MSDIFLSYSRKDTDFMRRVRDHFTNAGISVWTDESLEAGTPSWTFAIDQEIRRAKALVVILSPDSRQSIWVEKELALADTVGIPIYPILHRGTDADAIPFRLISTQRVDARQDEMRALNQLTTTLQKAFGAASAKSTHSCVVARTGAADFRTISDAIQKSPEGTVIHVRPGLYREGLKLTKAVEIIGDGPRDEIVIESNNQNCLLMDADYAVVKGLTLRARVGNSSNRFFCVNIPAGRLVLEDCDIASDSLACIGIQGEQAVPIIRRCRIHDGKDVGMMIYDNAGGVIEDCDIFANALSGIEIDSGGNPTVRQCRIHDGKENGTMIGENGAGIIENCDIFANGFSGIEIKLGGNPTVRECRIHDGKQVGVMIGENGAGIIENCDIFANGFSGIEIKLGGNPTVRQCRINNGKENGIMVGENGAGIIEDCDIFANTLSGIEIKLGGNPTVRECRINRNLQRAIYVHDGGKGTIENCNLMVNQRGAWDIDATSSVTRRNNRE